MIPVGLHLRLTSNLTELIQKAKRMQLPFFQSFLTVQHTREYISRDSVAIKEFIALRENNFKQLYVHASYAINLANGQPFTKRLLYKELELARRYQFTHLILHPGCRNDNATKEDGIDAIARLLNTVLKHERDIKIMLENSAHTHRSIGGSLEELASIRSKLDHPEKISFCIDTAHAHVFGYNLADISEQKKFIQHIDDTLSSQSIDLIHLNDSDAITGSFIDKHTVPGLGTIGAKALTHFISHPYFKHVPILLELPPLLEEEELAIVTTVGSWSTEVNELA